MIDEHRTAERTMPMMRSMLHGEPFPPRVLDDWIGKRRVWFIDPANKPIVALELDWMAAWSVMNWPLVMLKRLMTVRNDWSRK